jgi:hypothetical protein
MTLALAAGWFCLLAVLIAGPLLGRGYLLLLDYPSGPHFPDFSVFPLPSSGDVGNGVPLYALHTALRELVTTLPDKLYLVAPVVLGGIGVYRLVRRRLAVSALAAVYGGTLFVVNPFTYDRYLAGHLLVFPWHLYAVWSFSDGRIVANPAPSFFSREVLAGDEPRSPRRPRLWSASFAGHLSGISHGEEVEST